MSTSKNGSSERSTTRELPPGPQLASELASLGMRRRPGMGEARPARRSPRDKAFIDDLAELKRLGPLFPAESQADGADIESYAAAAIAMDAYLSVVERLHGGTMPGDSPIELARAHAAHVTEALTPDGELSCAYDCLLAKIWDQAMHTGTPPSAFAAARFAAKDLSWVLPGAGHTAPKPAPSFELTSPPLR